MKKKTPKIWEGMDPFRSLPVSSVAHLHRDMRRWGRLSKVEGTIDLTGAQHGM